MIGYSLIKPILPAFLGLFLFTACYQAENNESLFTLASLAFLLRSNANPYCSAYGSGVTSAGTVSTLNLVNRDETPPPSATAFPAGEESVEGEVLVTMAPGYNTNDIVTEARARRMKRKHGGKERHRAAKTLHLKGGRSVARISHDADGTSVRELMEDYKDLPGVVSVQPNYIYHSTGVPNDPDLTQQWGLKNSMGADINIEPLWTAGTPVTSCSNIIVAVIDSGVNYNHQDLSGNMWSTASVTCPSGGTAIHGCDFVNNDNNPMDEYGHGTHVAGILGATTNDSKGMAGVCWNTQIMALRALDPYDSGTTAEIIQAVDFAINNGAKVINMSLGTYSNDPLFYEALVRAKNNGLVVAAAAGNDSINTDVMPFYPASYSLDNLISVGAMDTTGFITDFSNCGAGSVDVVAPGYLVYSAYRKSQGYSYSGSWTSLGGTWLNETVNTYSGFSDPSGYGTAYANNLDTTYYGTFSTADNGTTIASFYLYRNLASGDTLSLVYGTGGGTPTTVSKSYTGSSNGYLELNKIKFPTSDIYNTAYQVGFHLTTDASSTSEGAFVYAFTMYHYDFSPTIYGTLNGTSMASPHLAGVAALLMQYAQDNAITCSNAQIVQAIKSGAVKDSRLTTLVSDGNRVDVSGALSILSSVCN